MPNKDELDSPTTVVGEEEEYFPSSQEKELTKTIEQLTGELEKKNDRIILQEKKIFGLEKKLKDYSEANKEFLEANEELWEKLQGKSVIYDALDQAYGNLGAENENLRDELEETLEIKQSQENSLKKLTQTISELEQTQQNQEENGIFWSEELTKLRQDLQELEQISQDYWETSQKEIKKWQIEAETHLDALKLAEIWNKDKFAKLEAQKQNLIELIREKNKDLTELLTKREKEVKGLTEQLTNTHQKLVRTKTYQQNRTNKLAKENNTLKIKLAYYQEQDKNLRNTIQDLQNEIGSHDCLPCSLPHLPTPHVCPIVQQVNCSHSDYASLQSQLVEKERIIQEQAQKIRELENKPPVVETKTIEKEVEKGESLEKIIEMNLNSLEKELGIELSGEAKEQIQKVSSYQELSLLRNREIKSYLAKDNTTTIQPNRTGITKSNHNERIFWVSLLVISLLTIGGLLVKLRSVARLKGGKRRI